LWVRLPPGRLRDNDMSKHQDLKSKIAVAVAVAFPNHSIDWCGTKSAAKQKGRTLGFRLRNAQGKHCSNIVWIDSSYTGEVDPGWAKSVVKSSNG